MCARYTVVTPVDELIEEFEATLVADAIEPKYNIAPTAQAPIVVASKEGERRLGLARFGLVPHWAKSLRDGVKMLNARVETVDKRPAYRAAFQKRRCLVVADGFYEWKREGKTKIPHRFHLGGRPFALAGLWAIWHGEDDTRVSSFTILTRPAIGAVATLHERMPIVLPREAYAAWIDRAEAPAGALHALLDDHLGEQLEQTQVSTRVNSVRNDDASLIEPVA